MHCKHLLYLTTFVVIVAKSTALNCFQCNGSDPTHPFQCNEWLGSDIDLTPTPCDEVYGAKYCIKHTGRFEGDSLMCYQCSGSETMDCSDAMIHMEGIEPKSCDHVFEAQYCIKTTSLYGGIGTKRFCSSLDLGNYCNYVQQPGDKLEYRSCVYTCTGDGCNPASTVTSHLSLVSCLLLFFFIVIFS
ncbi:U-scoloptoxin(05)-Sm1a [Anthonomus grandis grandis]|uniref:U-scoloptoxin(05)-Sm1a n=1 Tax=Anthonomus grandis grandis TaxID=2921223 RepID=UPI00216606F2|nr:U-scoloptoxin(05)-Sm1a [Anthonomus grandis grandis]